MISCHLNGGLGNQLFQIFTTIAYALKHSKPFFFLNIHQLGNAENNSTIRYTYWDKFLSSLQPFLKNINKIPKLNIVKEDTFNEEYNINGNTLLVGYFQKHKYFDSFKNTICRLIKLETKKTIVKNMVTIDLENINYISMHFRSGDYNKYPDVYPILTETYYENALNNLQIHFENEKEKENETKLTTILYFCENDCLLEFERIIEKLKSKFPKLVFERSSQLLNDWEQMILMSLCNHNIIANSTFSWWGAYLNSNEHKTVYYPKQWFINKDTTELCPEDWNAINIE